MTPNANIHWYAGGTCGRAANQVPEHPQAFRSPTLGGNPAIATEWATSQLDLASAERRWDPLPLVARLLARTPDDRDL